MSASIDQPVSSHPSFGQCGSSGCATSSNRNKVFFSTMLKWYHFFLLATVVWEASSLPQGVKGGVKGHIAAVGTNITNYFNSVNISGLRNFTTGSSHTIHPVKNNSKPIDYEKGVCYVEVPTVTLVKDSANVPAGNGSTPTLSKIRKCCPGYERNVHNFRICDPICENECINGRCVAPNVCTCHPDHVLDLDGYCVATCPIGCLNGHCGPDNECRCNAGYTEEQNMKFCVPKCSRGCSHGNCTAPEVCTCESGYKVNALGTCSPVCEGGCENGDCREPNKCFCLPKYIKNELGVCTPICTKGCDQGKCIAPDTCSCGEGFILNENEFGARCEAHCSQPCINGECSGPDQCTCKKGFTPDVNDPTGFRCIGHCPRGCPNGVCSGPNLCLCLPGYVKDRSVKGSQACMKRLRRSLPHPLKFMFE